MRRTYDAAYALPAAFTALLIIGATAAGSHEVGRGTHAWLCAVVLTASAGTGAAVSIMTRQPAFDARARLEDDSLVPQEADQPGLLRDLAVAVGRRRQAAAAALGIIALPLITIVLTANRSHLSLDDVLLLYLVTVLAITMVGGFWPAVVAAAAASLLVNWYFTPPVHTFTVDRPQNLVALLLFLTVAVSVSSIVHLSARRATVAGQAEALAAGNRLRTALLTAVGHELRTPLAAVKASVSSLRQTDIEWSAADQAELLATIEENADRLDALVGNLLDMSRIQTGSVQPSLRAVSLDEIAPLAVRGIDAAQVELDVSEDLPLVETDPGLLERAIANLVQNAVRYCPPGQPARLVAHAVDGVVQLDVIDHGPGVRAEMKDIIFEPFQQLGDRRNSEGVGLGLAVARGFVEAGGGTLVALDTPGGGLTMRTSLPVAP